MSHRIIMDGPDGEFETLENILPNCSEKLDILFVAKVPTPLSVEAGHYFQGRQGTAFWNKLISFGLLMVPENEKEDDVLLVHKYGIMDIVKKPRSYGTEPTEEEYKEGFPKILCAIAKFNPKVTVFVYKKVLDNILKYNFGIINRSIYGFNNNLSVLFKENRVFVFPMPGTPVTKELADRAMNELVDYINSN